MSPPANSKFKNPRAKFNFQGRTCSIAGVGSYVPAKILTNADMEKLVDTSDEWITTRTGIKERHIAAADEFTSDLAAQAARAAQRRHIRHPMRGDAEHRVGPRQALAELLPEDAGGAGIECQHGRAVRDEERRQGRAHDFASARAR